MVKVAPLKYGPIFKRAFSNPEVFGGFASDVLGMPVRINRVHTEYEYPEPVGFVRSRYDLFAEDESQRLVVEIQQLKEEDFFDRFLYYHITSMVEQVRGYWDYRFERTVYTIVVLTSVPQDGSVNFSCAVSDFSPVNEHGNKVPVYPHRLVFLTPRLAGEHTPPAIRKWLDFITDSLDEEIEESRHEGEVFQKLIQEIRRETISPAEWAEIKDEAAWERAKARFAAEGHAEGRAKGRAEGRAEGLAEGRAEERRHLVSKLLEGGLAMKQIADITGLSIAEIEDMQR